MTRSACSANAIIRCTKCGQTFYGGEEVCEHLDVTRSDIPTDGPGSHRADLAEMRAQTARADKAEAQAAAMRECLLDWQASGAMPASFDDALASDAGRALVEELARLREAVYGPRDMTRQETVECMVKRLREERDHYQDNFHAERQRADKAEKERDEARETVICQRDTLDQYAAERDAAREERDEAREALRLKTAEHDHTVRTFADTERGYFDKNTVLRRRIREVEEALRKSAVRIGILVGRMRGCDDPHGPVHELSIAEGEAWIEEERAILDGDYDNSSTHSDDEDAG